MKNRLFVCLAAIFAIAGACAASGVPAYPNFGLPRVEEMAFLVLQIGIIIFAAKIGGIVAGAFKLPTILGELGVGILIGPWALGGVGFGDGMFQYGLFNGAALKQMNAVAFAPDGGPGAAASMFGTVAGGGKMFDAASPALYGIATLASVILLFLSGLETNIKMFLKYSFVGLMVGLGGVIVSFAFGNLCAVYLLPEFFPTAFGHLSQIPLTQACMEAAPLYMGIMSTATSVGITARILSERKKMDTEEGVSIMAGAVIDDVLGLVVLAIGNGIIAASIKAKMSGGTATAGVNWMEIGMVAVKAFGVWLGATLIGVVCARKISWLLKLFKNRQAIATLAFGLSLILAGFFECMGLAMIIGAYVTGLALSRTDLKHVIQETLSPVYTFLVPIFFCVMGMMVDCSALLSKPVICFGLIYTALAVGAKILGCAVPSMFCGFNLLGSLRIGAGMVPRGEVALIIAGLGLSKGYLSQEIFGIGILMTLITTMVAPPALVGLFSPKARGVRNPKDSMTDSGQETYKFPDEQVAKVVLRKLVNEFRKEGFFAVQLLHEAHMAIWEISMDQMELTMVRHENEIKVECNKNERRILFHAWQEVASEINELASTIQEPLLSHVAFAHLLAASEEPAAEKKKSNTHLAAKHVQHFAMIPDFKAYSKLEALNKLVDVAAEKFPQHFLDREMVRKAVIARENSMGTGLDRGIAVPHGRTDGVKNIVGVVALVDNSGNENGIIPDYETFDHSKVQIIVLTLVPESLEGPYLQIMAFISKVLHSSEASEKLLECKTEAEMREFFKNQAK